MREGLWWLPRDSSWDEAVRSLKTAVPDHKTFDRIRRLATANIDVLETAKLDRAARRIFDDNAKGELSVRPCRVALLGSSTLDHLAPGIRVAGLRRGLVPAVYVGGFGQYMQELSGKGGGLATFAPTVICFGFDARHLHGLAHGDAARAVAWLENLWRTAKERHGCLILQQSVLPVFPNLLGSNEHRARDSSARFVVEVNQTLEASVDAAGVDLLRVDKIAATEGLSSWHDPSLWNRSKHDISPRVAHLWGEHAMRVIAAHLGLSAKCLVTDLDNTIWGGVIGDDGLEGIVLAEGSAQGESFRDFQRYLLALKNRGVVLAVCSKNDMAYAVLPFEKHPDMLLKRSDFGAVVINWSDKAANLRHIAKVLNIGLDSLVFVDDNAFERNLVRQELPEVAVPEMPEDPAFFSSCLSAAGYFEAVTLTEEDRGRAEQYQANADRQALHDQTTDLDGYLRGLDMAVQQGPFRERDLARVVQLINKTNQFNLTTRRYNEAQVRAIMANPAMLTWQLRLRDRFGDNGLIAILIAKKDGAGSLTIDSWLMSCRVFGRQVEDLCLNLVADAALSAGIERIDGAYLPTQKNAVVRDLFKTLGFTKIAETAEGGTRWVLPLARFKPRSTHIRITEHA